MKLYNVTFSIGDTKKYSMPAVADSTEAAESNVGELFHLLCGVQARRLKANAVVFGVDGKGKSLNKLKRKPG